MLGCSLETKHEEVIWAGCHASLTRYSCHEILSKIRASDVLCCRSKINSWHCLIAAVAISFNMLIDHKICTTNYLMF